MKFSLKSLLLLVAAVSVLILIGSFAIRSYHRHAGVTHTGVSSQTANQILPASLALPDTASDITVYVDFGAAESEFAVSEDAFLAWCKSRGWTPTRISSPIPYFEPMCLQADTRSVSRGYTFVPPDGDGVFDAERSRAAFWTSTFP